MREGAPSNAGFAGPGTEVGAGDQADNDIREVRKIGANNLSERLQLPAARDELYQWGETLNSFLHKLDMSFEPEGVGIRKHEDGPTREFNSPILSYPSAITTSKDFDFSSFLNTAMKNKDSQSRH